MSTVDEMTEDLEEVSSPTIHEGFIDVKGLITALDSLRMDIQKHITQNEEVQRFEQFDYTLDLEALADRLLLVKETSATNILMNSLV